MSTKRPFTATTGQAPTSSNKAQKQVVVPTPIAELSSSLTFDESLLSDSEVPSNTDDVTQNEVYVDATAELVAENVDTEMQNTEVVNTDAAGQDWIPESDNSSVAFVPDESNSSESVISENPEVIQDTSVTDPNLELPNDPNMGNEEQAAEKLGIDLEVNNSLESLVEANPEVPEASNSELSSTSEPVSEPPVTQSQVTTPSTTTQESNIVEVDDHGNNISTPVPFHNKNVGAVLTRAPMRLINPNDIYRKFPTYFANMDVKLMTTETYTNSNGARIAPKIVIKHPNIPKNSKGDQESFHLKHRTPYGITPMNYMEPLGTLWQAKEVLRDVIENGEKKQVRTWEVVFGIYNPKNPKVNKYTQYIKMSDKPLNHYWLIKFAFGPINAHSMQFHTFPLIDEAGVNKEIHDYEKWMAEVESKIELEHLCDPILHQNICASFHKRTRETVGEKFMVELQKIQNICKNPKLTPQQRITHEKMLKDRRREYAEKMFGVK